jgi:calcineurin-like phosphoesterase family protein
LSAVLDLRQSARPILLQQLLDFFRAASFCHAAISAGSSAPLNRDSPDAYKEIAEVSIRNQPIVLCHYAMRVSHQSGRGAWQLYGYSHGKLPSVEGSRSMDVGVDTNALRPYSFDEIRAKLPA